MKKKLLIGVLALVMCFTLVGCGKTESNNNNNSNNNQKENSTKAEKTISSDVEITSTSSKDQYESNNDFESATNITIYEFSQYIENEMIVEGTLNRDPWYKLFWRDIDEDY